MLRLRSGTRATAKDGFYAAGKGVTKLIKFVGLPDDAIVVIDIEMQVFHGIFSTCPKNRQAQTASETSFVVQSFLANIYLI